MSAIDDGLSLAFVSVESDCHRAVAMQDWGGGLCLQEERCRTICCSCCLSQTQSKNSYCNTWTCTSFVSYVSVVICPFPSLCAKEMGVIGPDNQLPKRRAGRGRGGLHTLIHNNEDDSWTDDVHVSRAKADEQKQSPPPVEDHSNVSEALSLFPQPKSLLTRVIQVATSSNRIRVGSSHPCHNESWSLLAYRIF